VAGLVMMCDKAPHASPPMGLYASQVMGRDSSVHDLATAALGMVTTDPPRARELAVAARDRALAANELGAAAMAERAAGMAAKEQHDLDAAITHLRRAVQLARRSALDDEAVEALLQLAPTLAFHGDSGAALAAIEEAAAAANGEHKARLHLQRANVLLILGRPNEALHGYRRALPALRAAGDVEREAQLLNNRAMILADRGTEAALAAAHDDLGRAEELYSRVGSESIDLAEVRQNLGFVAARRGHIAEALAWFDRADEYFRAKGIVDAVGLRDRCEALVAARLFEEARATAEAAVVQLGREGRASYLAEAQLILAQAALLQGDTSTAQATAAEAARAFGHQRRVRWRQLARLIALRSEWAGGSCSRALAKAARRLADSLEESRWLVPALDARLIAAAAALRLGDSDAARRDLERIGRPRRGPVELRARAWHAQALLRLAAGDRRGALSALRAGLRLVEIHRASLGDLELRALSSAHAEELARTGLRLALHDGQARRAVAWAERWRAGSLHLPPVRPPDDDAWAADLAALRGVVREIDEATLAGRDTADLVARQVGLEKKVVRRARHAIGPGFDGSRGAPSVDDLTAALAERALVEIVELDGQLHGVAVVSGRIRLRPLAALAEVLAELDYLRFALTRLASGVSAARSLASVAAAADHAGRRLDELLLRPLARDIGDRPLVVVPTGPLYMLPWSALPSCLGRAVTVAPSATMWLDAASRSGLGPDPHVTLVAGPGLSHAEPEVREIAASYSGASCLTGPSATVSRVTAALDGTDVAHIAAHGRFRSDNPMFSSLSLSDGPLTVYDLEALQAAPRVMILSACDAAMARVHTGDELIGLASAVFSLGSRTLVASVIPVPDEATRPFMVEFHRLLRAGVSPAAALATVQGEVTGGAAVAVARGFVCFGAG
jgi:tetratricopeptide (TPR) repeat protein